MEETGKMKSKIEFLIKHNPAVQSLYRGVVGAVFRLWGKGVHLEDKTVLFSSFSGKRYDDSPRCIFEAMRDDPRFEGFAFIWALNNPEEFDIPGAVKVKMDSPAYFRAALRSKYWVTNVNIERGLRFKNPRTVYLNTWHGTPVKTIGNAVKGRTDYDFSSVDVITSDGPFFTGVMTRDFGALPENVIECGRPCDDALFRLRNKGTAEFKRKLGIDEAKEVILYAPTWRESLDGGASFNFKPPIDISRWRDFLGKDKVLLFRAHSIMSKVLDVEFDERVVDVTSYPDINDLILASDCLISDYSGTYFDYAITGKPMFCFCYDYEEYSSQRGLYFDVRNHITSFTNEGALLSYLANFDREAEIAKTEHFLKEFSGAGGDAVSTCISALVEKGR